MFSLRSLFGSARRDSAHRRLRNLRRSFFEQLENRGMMAVDLEIPSLDPIADEPPAIVAPVAVKDSYSVLEDEILASPYSVLANDSSPNGIELTATLLASPTFGTLQFDSLGNFVYEPSPNYSGTDTFTYKASDGVAESPAVTVSIAVKQVNDLPEATADLYDLSEYENGILSPLYVLSNDHDPDCMPLTPILMTQPLHGSATLNSDGSITYTPTGNYRGPDQFTYQISDGLVESHPVTVDIIGEPEPVARIDYTITIADALSVNEAEGWLKVLISVSPLPAEGATVPIRVFASASGHDDGHARAGFEFSDEPIDLVFDSTSATREVAIPLIDDADHEPSETLRLNATLISTSITPVLQTTVTIVDNDVEYFPPLPSSQHPAWLAPEPMLANLQTAIELGQKEFVIPPGTYDFTGETQQFRLAGVSDLAVRAEGVTFIFSPRVRAIAVYLDQCTQVTLSGLTIDYDPLPFTQGTITEVRADQSFVVELDANYPLLDNTWTPAGGGNAKTIVFAPDGSMRPQLMDWLATATQIGERSFLVTTKHSWVFNGPGSMVQVGDSIAFPDRQFRQTIELSACTDVTIDGVTLWSAPQMGFLSADSVGTTIINCEIIRKPGTDRLLTSNSDGMYSVNGQNVTIQNNRIEYTGDDMLNIHTRMQIFLSDGLTLAWRPGDFQVGQVIQLYDENAQLVGEATVQSFEPVADPAVTEQAQAQAVGFGLFRVMASRMTAYRLTLDRSFTGPLFISNDALRPVDNLVEGNEFRGGYGRGAILSGSGVIRNNTFEDMSSASIWLGADLQWGVGALPRNITVEGNTIRNSNRLLHPLPQLGAISIGQAFRSNTELIGSVPNVILHNNYITGSRVFNIVGASSEIIHQLQTLPLEESNDATDTTPLAPMMLQSTQAAESSNEPESDEEETLPLTDPMNALIDAIFLAFAEEKSSDSFDESDDDELLLAAEAIILGSEF